MIPKPTCPISPAAKRSRGNGQAGGHGVRLVRSVPPPDGNYVVTAASLYTSPSPDAVLTQAPPVGFPFSQPDSPGIAESAAAQLS